MVNYIGVFEERYSINCLRLICIFKKKESKIY